MRPPLIDAHTHAYDGSVHADPRRWASARGEDHWARLTASHTREGLPLQAWVDIEEMLDTMQAQGVDAAILLGWYWQHHATCLEQIAWYKTWTQRAPTRLFAFCPVQPLAGDAALESIRRAADAGFRGIGELNPVAQGYDIRGPAFRKVVELACTCGMAINLHVSEPVGRDHPGRLGNPLADFHWLAQTYPEARLILAHYGGLLPFCELNPSVQRSLRNVVYDTAASPLLYRADIHRLVLEAVGPRKILFGTDYPLRLIPRNAAPPDFLTLAESIRQHVPNPDDAACILGLNAATLLDLPVAQK